MRAISPAVGVVALVVVVVNCDGVDELPAAELVLALVPVLGFVLVEDMVPIAGTWCGLMTSWKNAR